MAPYILLSSSSLGRLGETAPGVTALAPLCLSTLAYSAELLALQSTVPVFSLAVFPARCYHFFTPYVCSVSSVPCPRVLKVISSVFPFSVQLAFCESWTGD